MEKRISEDSMKKEYGRGSPVWDVKPTKGANGSYTVTVPVVDTPFTEEDLATTISIGMSGRCGFDSMDWNDGEYRSARDSLLADGREKVDITMEDVLARLLLEGGTISLLEADTEDDWYEIRLPDILRGLAMWAATCEWGGLDGLVNGEGDFLDADMVFQIAAFGEVMIG